jgi:acyl-CoA synthetase (AMP-forming)/AMP-acid ligase II
VVGVPDAVSSERVAALIVTDADFDRSTLSRQLGERLSSYQMPQRLEVATALPRTPLGKVDYAAVKRLMSDDEVTIT